MFVMRLLFVVAAVAIVAIQIPQYLQPDETQPDAAVRAANPVLVKQAASSPGFTIRANGSGHYESRFVLNGKVVNAMVDTGATFVAMNEATAKSIGLGADRLHFTMDVETANGRAQAAMVVLASIEIGSIRVRNVEALVMRGTGLQSVLIGMSFMQKLRSYRVENDRMQLVN